MVMAVQGDSIRLHPDEETPNRAGRAVEGPLTPEQERLVTDHLGLARMLARRFAGRGEARDDLEQVACLALVRAARRFDPDRQVSFSTYGVSCAIGEIKRHFRDRHWLVRPPRSMHDTHLAVRQAAEELQQDLGRGPTILELSTHLGVSEEQILEAGEVARNRTPVSLDQPQGEDGVAPIDMLTVEDESFDRVVDRRHLAQLLPQLSDQEKTIIKLYFFENWTQRQIGAAIGVSQMQVSRVLDRCLKRLRACLLA